MGNPNPIILRLIYSEKFNFFLLILPSVAIWLWSDCLTVEVPYMVPFLPEGWKLGSFVVLMKGLSTCSLFLLPLFLKPGVASGTIVCFLLGLVFSVMIIFMWDLKLPGNALLPRGLSFGFLINAFFLMGLDSLRMTLVYVLATTMFQESFMTAVLIGDACGGLFASGISYIQGYNHIFINRETTILQNGEVLKGQILGGRLSMWNDNGTDIPLLYKDFVFGPHVAFALLTGCYAICFIALLVLIYINSGRHRFEYSEIGTGSEKECDDVLQESSPLHSADRSTRTSRTSESETSEKPQEAVRKIRTIQESISFKWYDRTFSLRHKYFLWATWFIASGSVFTLMPAFQSFSTLPYSQRCFMLSASFWSLSFPITAILAHYVRVRQVAVITCVLIFHVSVCLILILIAARSPDPGFGLSFNGEPIMVLLWVAQGSSGFFLFSTASYCLRELDEEAVKWGSVAAQIGDVFGSALAFVLINFSGLFIEYH